MRKKVLSVNHQPLIVLLVPYDDNSSLLEKICGARDKEIKKHLKVP